MRKSDGDVRGYYLCATFSACNTFTFIETWAVFVQHSIARILKCIFLVEVHKIMRTARAYRTYYAIGNVPTEEVGGCFDSLHITLLDA